MAGLRSNSPRGKTLEMSREIRVVRSFIHYQFRATFFDWQLRMKLTKSAVVEVVSDYWEYFAMAF